MKKYIRAEYFDKNGDTAFQNIYIADIKERTWNEILTFIEQRSNRTFELQEYNRLETV